MKADWVGISQAICFCNSFFPPALMARWFGEEYFPLLLTNIEG